MFYRKSPYLYNSIFTPYSYSLIILLFIYYHLRNNYYIIETLGNIFFKFAVTISNFYILEISTQSNTVECGVLILFNFTYYLNYM